MQFVQNAFLELEENLLVQSYGNTLHFLLFLVFGFGYIKKRLWLQAIVQQCKDIQLFSRNSIFYIPFRENVQQTLTIAEQWNGKQLMNWLRKRVPTCA